MAVFEQGSELRQFFRGQNKQIEAWLAKNQEAAGLDGPVSKPMLSRALAGHDTNPTVVDALDSLFDAVARDPWSFCAPPTDLDNLTDYASCRWWYDTLQPAVSWSRFERINQFPLAGADREIVQESFDRWRDSLKAACEQYQNDFDLVRSLQSDAEPEYQTWSQDPWRLDARGSIKRRVGFPGLAGRSPDEIGRALALDMRKMPLPDVANARLDYTQPHSVPVDDYDAVAVEPWNGDEFEGVEEQRVEGKLVRHRVTYYWDGQRYQIEDVEKFKWIDDGGWRETTDDELSMYQTGMIREEKSRDEFLANKEAWIDEVWESRKQAASFSDSRQFPDGIPRSAIEEQFEIVLSRYEEGGEMAERAIQEQQEFSRRKVAFMRTLRRRS